MPCDSALWADIFHVLGGKRNTAGFFQGGVFNAYDGNYVLGYHIAPSWDCLALHGAHAYLRGLVGDECYDIGMIGRKRFVECGHDAHYVVALNVLRKHFKVLG